MKSDSDSVQDLYAFGRQILQEALVHGARDTAQLLGTFFATPWSSSLEALGEYRIVLHQVEAEVIACFPPEEAISMRQAVASVDKAVERWFRG